MREKMKSQGEKIKAQGEKIKTEGEKDRGGKISYIFPQLKYSAQYHKKRLCSAGKI